MKAFLVAATLLAIAADRVWASFDSDQLTSSYNGICDASAALAIGQDHFVVADDERNVLRVHKKGWPVQISELDLTAMLDGKEGDIEGAARIGNRIYWVTSHGLNKSGELRPQRFRFFATDVDESTEPPQLRSVGKAYVRLRDRLIATDKFSALDFKSAALRSPESPAPPGGLNIEGMAAGKDGRSVLLGFRSPLPDGQAIVIPLLNPDEVVISGTEPRFGDAELLDLAGNGIRSMELMGDEYVLVAGPRSGSGEFALHRWRGLADPVPERLGRVADLNPEALFVTGPDQLYLLSDDGERLFGKTECKDLKPAAQRQSFRGRAWPLR